MGVTIMVVVVYSTINNNIKKHNKANQDQDQDQKTHNKANQDQDHDQDQDQKTHNKANQDQDQDHDQDQDQVQDKGPNKQGPG